VTPIRVLLADDHETVRQGLRLVLEAQPDIAVVGEAADGRAAIERAVMLKPHVVVLDISMPTLGGLHAARALRQSLPDVAIVALTRHDDEAYARDLMMAGACGYVLKRSPSSELVNAIRAAASGGRYLDPALSTGADIESRRRPIKRPPISERESSVLRLMAIGHSNKEIADRLDISVKTVEVHKANAMRKLALRGRIDVIRYAAMQGWLQDP
jgi:DNA-binding NarL/FixJ family response regulator